NDAALAHTFLEVAKLRLEHRYEIEIQAGCSSLELHAGRRGTFEYQQPVREHPMGQQERGLIEEHNVDFECGNHFPEICYQLHPVVHHPGCRHATIHQQGYVEVAVAPRPASRDGSENVGGLDLASLANHPGYNAFERSQITHRAI